MKLFRLNFRKSKTERSACLYHNDADSICTYLSGIVTYQNDRMFQEFTEQKQLIIKNHEDVLMQLKRQDARNRQEKNENEKRIVALEAYMKPRNMFVFDSVLRFKWAVIAWIIFISIVSLSTMAILYFHIA